MFGCITPSPHWWSRFRTARMELLLPKEEFVSALRVQTGFRRECRPVRDSGLPRENVLQIRWYARRQVIIEEQPSRFNLLNRTQGPKGKFFAFERCGEAQRIVTCRDRRSSEFLSCNSSHGYQFCRSLTFYRFVNSHSNQQLTCSHHAVKTPLAFDSHRASNILNGTQPFM